MIFADKEDYFYGKIQCDTCDFPEDAAHAPAGDDMVGTKVLGCSAATVMSTMNMSLKVNAMSPGLLVSMQNPISI
jgi:hypothetical protein